VSCRSPTRTTCCGHPRKDVTRKLLTWNTSLRQRTIARPHVQTSSNSLHMLPAAVTPSSSGGVALPVLWMTSRLPLIHQTGSVTCLRSSSSANLYVSHTNLHFGSHSFHTAAPTVWNSLPPFVRLRPPILSESISKPISLFQSAFDSPYSDYSPAPRIRSDERLWRLIKLANTLVARSPSCS